MDLATVIGFVGAFAIVGASMALGGSVLVFINIPSMLVVVVGTMLVVLMKYNLGQFLTASKIAIKSFFGRSLPLDELIEKIVELADAARKGGLLSLEEAEVDDEFLQKGIGLLVDGHDGEVVKTILGKDVAQTQKRHELGVEMFLATGDVAPAMGMIGTLIGLVQMLSAMDDPKSIGPAMAVALLTTLYGAIMANMGAIPIANKLTLRSNEEKTRQLLIIDGLLGIQAGQNPRVIDQVLRNYLESGKRSDEEDGEAAAEG